MKNLYIDFDGVIMDTIPTLYKALEESGVNSKDVVETTLFFSQYDYSTIINDDNILNDSIKNIEKLIESGKFNISFLTHVNSLPEAVVKINYLRKHFKDITIIITPYVISKTKMVNSKDAVLVDDYSGNLEEWRRSGGTAIRFNKDLDSKGFEVINSLDKLLTIFCDE